MVRNFCSSQISFSVTDKNLNISFVNEEIDKLITKLIPLLWNDPSSRINIIFV